MDRQRNARLIDSIDRLCVLSISVLTVEDRDEHMRLDDFTEVEAAHRGLLSVDEDGVDVVFDLFLVEESQRRSNASASVHCKRER